MLWFIFAVMTATAVFAVLWPFGRKAAIRGGSDRLVYQDQLQEIARDRSAGLIGDSEAETARIEISRRLLAAADAEAQILPVAATQAAWHRRAAMIAAIVVAPAVALGLYLKLGAPDVPAQTAFARVNARQEHQSIAKLVNQVEAHLARDPADGAGWEVIAPIYLHMGRFNDAVEARRRAIALNGDTAARESDLGEALVAAANGVVTAEAKQVFQKAINKDPHEAQARYFLGLADQQDGNTAAAAVKWRALLDEAPPGAPWVEFVRTALAGVSGAPAAANGPTAVDIAAADTMTEEQRTAMIRGMVQRLAARLHADGSDMEGWLRLVRAYAVLGDRDKAKGAAADARRALSDHPDEIKRVDDLVKGLGLES